MIHTIPPTLQIAIKKFNNKPWHSLMSMDIALSHF